MRSPAARLGRASILIATVNCMASTPAPSGPSPASPPAAPVAATPSPPVAPRRLHKETWHGQERSDDWFWLREKDTPPVLDYLKAENAYTASVLAPTEALQKRLFEEMVGRLKETDVSVPYRRDGFYYLSRTEKGKQYPTLIRRKGAADAADEVILDLNEIAQHESFVGLGDVEVSDDTNLLAYTLDTKGFRQYTLYIKDLRTGRLLPDRAARVTGVAFASDGKTVLYTQEHEVTKRSHRLFRHTVGEADAGRDTLVYEEKDELFDLGCGRTRSRAFFVVTSQSKTTTEVRVIPADKPAEAPRVVAPRRAGHEYYVDHRGGDFLIRSNATGRNFRLCQAPVGRTAEAGWKEVVPHRPDVMLAGIDVFKDFTVLAEREGGLPQLAILDARGGARHRIVFPEAVYTAGPENNAEFETARYRLQYQSPVTPNTVFDYDLGRKELISLKRTEVPNYDPALYEVARLLAPAPDGTNIPVSLVFKKGVKPAPGGHPLMLYGYGSYGISIPDSFSTGRFSLVDRGVVYAIAHIRGGGELGKPWHDQGRMLNKLTTFSDFIAVAEALVKEGWTAPDKLAIQGGSAGGLLMGAVINMRPDLWKAVVANVPFVDVINTMLDETLPLTVSEFEEWGNPKVKAEYDYMMRYSPYDNVAPRAYPAILVRTAYYDSQVMYWEPAKWVARLRTVKTGPEPLLFKCSLEAAGHGGASGRYDHLKEVAFDYAFVLWQLGL